MMQRLIWLILVLGLLAGPVAAQDADPADAERRSVLAHRLIEASQSDNMNKMVERQIQTQLADLSGVSDAQAAWMRANMPRFALAMVADLLDSLTDLYAETFTAEELEAQIALFEGPHGRSIANKAFAFGVAQSAILAEAQTVFLNDFIAKFCAEFECPSGDAAAKPATRR